MQQYALFSIEIATGETECPDTLRSNTTTGKVGKWVSTPLELWIDHSIGRWNHITGKMMVCDQHIDAE
jgi:hypothetical protein